MSDRTQEQVEAVMAVLGSTFVCDRLYEQGGREFAAELVEAARAAREGADPMDAAQSASPMFDAEHREELEAGKSPWSPPKPWRS